MTEGRLIAVVGPSGVGKDSLMAGLIAARPELQMVRRWITRPEEAGGEPHVPVTVQDFHKMESEGAFCLSWGAHGLHYGIPADLPAQIAAGRQALVNLSRGALARAGRVCPSLVVLNVTARPEVLARRLAGRGRETLDEIAARLARTARIPDGLRVIEVDNNDTLEAAVARALAALYPVKV